MKKFLFAVGVVCSVCAADGEPPAQRRRVEEETDWVPAYGRILQQTLELRGNSPESGSANLRRADDLVRPFVEIATAQLDEWWRLSVDQARIGVASMESVDSILNEMVRNNQAAHMRDILGIRRLQWQARLRANRLRQLLQPPRLRSGSPVDVTDRLPD